MAEGVEDSHFQLTDLGFGISAVCSVHEIADGIVWVDVRVPHTNFPEVARMVFVEVNTMMMLTTSVTATSRMFPMLANMAMTMGHCRWSPSC